MSKEEASEIIKQSQYNAEIQTESISAKGITLIQNYQDKISIEINKLRQIIEENKENETAPHYENLKNIMFQKMERDISIIEKINVLKASFLADPLNKLSSPVKTNKILDSILLAKDFLDKNFDELYDNKIPEGYQYHRPEVLNFIEYNEGYIWGSPKAIQLQVTLFYMAAVITNKTNFANIELNLYKDSLCFADESTIAHIEPVNSEMDLSKIEGIENFSWFFKDAQTEQAFLTIPGGYTFGGGRGSTRHLRDLNNKTKEQPTHDCSSFVADVCEIKDVMKFSTIDQYLVHNIGIQNPAFKDNKNYSTEVVEKFNMINAKDLPNFLNDKNLVYGRRAFDADDKASNSLGVGGHTGIVLGFDNKNNTVIISTSREIDTKKDENIKETLAQKHIGYGAQIVSSVESMTNSKNIVRTFFSQFKGNTR